VPLSLETAMDPSLPQIHKVESGPAVMSKVRNWLWYSRHTKQWAGDTAVISKAAISRQNAVLITSVSAP
jgi:hypothetical protein